MRKLQLLLGIILAIGAFLGVLLIGKITQPATYEVTVVLQEIPAYTRLTGDTMGLDTQSLSASVADKYVLSDEFENLLAEGVVAVENLHPGQPLLREQVASGAEVKGLTRLAVALDDPDQVIFSVAIDQDKVPPVVPGDVVALFFTTGQIQAHSLITETVEDELEAGEGITRAWPSAFAEDDEVITTTIELAMPMAKWVANGIVYRLNQERKENPNYGAPGMENEPRYIEGKTRSLDIVIHRDTAEWIAFIQAHGQIQVAVLPAVAKQAVEAGTFPPEPGVTWTDFEDRFWAERAEVEGK
jgi:hypothetical protein